MAQLCGFTAFSYREDCIIYPPRDDYITKPFSFAVLRARVHAVLRHDANESSVFRIKKRVFDFDKLEFLADGRQIKLSKTEQRLFKNIKNQSDNLSFLIQSLDKCSCMVKKQATENKCAALFQTKETKDQKTSIMEMCITGCFIESPSFLFHMSKVQDRKIHSRMLKRYRKRQKNSPTSG